MANYKNIYSGEIISEYHYNNLSDTNKRKYVRTYESATHTIEESSTGDIITTMLITDMLSDNMSSDNSFNSGSDSFSDNSPSSDFSGGGGGDFGGGGAGSDF